MDYAEFVNGISFRYVQPHQPRPFGYHGLSAALRAVGMHLEVWNTVLPDARATVRRALAPVLKIPRMSTFAVGAIINHGVRQLPAGQAYVNVGVWHGYTLLAGMAGNANKRCIGIDDFKAPGSPMKDFFSRFEKMQGKEHEFHLIDFREHLKCRHEGPIGFFCFDGPTTYQDLSEALTLAEPHLADGALVLVDDTNWEPLRKGCHDFIARSMNEYRMLLDVRTPNSGHPTFWNGVILFQKVGRRASAIAKGGTKRRAA